MPPPTTSPAQPVAGSYWTDAAVRLAKGSFDTKAAAKAKKTATAPGTYVSDLQADLIQLGYLPAKSDDGSFGEGTERAVKHFQRHAARTQRMQGGAIVTAPAWVGPVTGVVDIATAKEIRVWIDKKFSLPLGPQKIIEITGGRMRDDVAKLWDVVLDDIGKVGGALWPDGTANKERYSDTWRNPANGFKHTGGNSRFSLHYTGRAVDLNMVLAGGKGRRWWIVKESVNAKTYWRIYCKTEKQDGSQGTKIAAKTKKYYELYKNEGEKWFPEGHYLDLTDFLSTRSFERIPAQDGWENVAKKQEWWHFYYAKDIRETFGDEMEVIGYTRTQMQKFGWSDADLETAPG
ncbi:MAG TPA: peptidoglycan-binding domain-containing protein [Acetobacteraceae bacterium]|nr:peptidoglycan-binding domain-containing protein [Acetobacteraceae bacterium]